ncbi:MAG TPA: DUF4124 domain-containing protein [Steroidobacteraceae bacterium]|nr:DUF4124 domain-containing protein [Steroidobacteraceae bacterium]
MRFIVSRGSRAGLPRTPSRGHRARARAACCSLLLAVAALQTSGLVLGASSSAPVYRWVDENGVVHYGDQVPPQYSQQEKTLLDRQGMVIGHTEAQKSAAELERDAREQEQLQKQKQHDAFLLTTYASVKDIELLRDERLEQVQGQRVAAEQYVASLNERLVGLQSRAQAYKPYSDEARARRMPDELAEELVHAMNEIRGQREVVSAREHEESQIRTQFQADIDRFRELRSPPPDAH